MIFFTFMFSSNESKFKLQCLHEAFWLMAVENSFTVIDIPSYLNSST